MPNSLCLCGSQLPAANCCQQFISAQAIPQTPLQLMRSRYTAYCQANIEYIVATMRGIAAKNFNAQQAAQRSTSLNWKKLEIINAPVAQGNTGFVEFKAYYVVDHQLQVMHETSKFKRIAGRWYYVSGHSYK